MTERGKFERRHVPSFEKYIRAREVRRDAGYEPVRCCCTCRLIGWLTHAGAHRIESATIKSSDAITLTYAKMFFGVIETGENDPDRRSEHAWKSNDYTLEQLATFPDFDPPTERERLLDPAPSWLLAEYSPDDNE